MGSRHSNRDANDDDDTLLITSKSSLPLIMIIIAGGDINGATGTCSDSECRFCVTIGHRIKWGILAASFGGAAFLSLK